MWREFHKPRQTIWNTFLATFLILIESAAFFGLRYIGQKHVEVGEARFTSARRNVDDS